MTECISNAGVATNRRKRSEGNVILRARARVAGFTVLEISHRISSTRTAERAMLEEKVALARAREEIRICFHMEVFSRSPKLDECVPSRRGLFCEWPERSGKSLCDTATATMRNVRTNGRKDIASVDGRRWTAHSGTHASQSSDGIIGVGFVRKGVGRWRRGVLIYGVDQNETMSLPLRSNRSRCTQFPPNQHKLVGAIYHDTVRK